MKSRLLKLALVTRRYPPLIGGAEKVLSYLANAFAIEGADVTVLTSRMPTLGLEPRTCDAIVESSNFKHNYNIGNGRLKVVHLETSHLRFWGTWRYMRNLRTWFRENSIDLAYVSMLKHDAYTAVGSGERFGFPVVLRPEGAGATGDIAWQSQANFGRLIGCRCRRATAFVAISKEIECELREAWHFGTMQSSRLAGCLNRVPTDPRVAMIPNGVPMPISKWQRRINWQQSPRAVFVGRLAPEKGLDVLIQAWPFVRINYPDARLILVGEGPVRSELEHRVRACGMTLGPGQTVELLGAISAPGEILREADLFILPSREEGMSISLLEAMALGMPLVASSIPGNRQLVSDFRHGRLAPLDDPASLAHVISAQWSEFDRAIRMGHAARNRVEQEFSIQSIARKHLALFEDILCTHHSP